MSSYYLSTPIYYVNDLPHLGHIYTTVIADTVARYQRLRGQEVFYLTGTDEHGQNIQRAANRQGIEPIQLADRVVSRYHDLWSVLNISHNDFIRTTEPRHRRGVEALIARIEAAGDLYTANHDGWYCSSCESFYTEKEIGNEKLCPVHGSTTEWQSEENVFFRLSEYQQPLLDWLDSNPEAVQPVGRLNEVRSFIESGLRDLSVSRADLKWGIPFPGHPGQTIYVWLDALTNYVSALGLGAEGDEKTLYDTFWNPDGGVRLHIVGKDILRFHAIYWPAFLLSAGLPLPTTVWAHGWWLRDEKKMSKSIGNVVRPDALIRDFGADSLRFYLLREMVFGQDAQFSDEAFVDRFNSDLANDLGNTVSRVVTLSRRAFDGCTPPESCFDNPLVLAAREAIEGYRAGMDELAFDRALRSLWGLLAATNQYLVAREPWRLIKKPEQSEALSRVLWNGLEAVRIVATALLPCMPELAPQVLKAVGAEGVPADFSSLSWGLTPTGVELPKSVGLFPRIDKSSYLAEIGGDKPREAIVDRVEKARLSELQEQAGKDSTGEPSKAPDTPPEPVVDAPRVSIGDFFKTQLKVGTVISAEAIPKSNKLLKLQVDLGTETRTVVAGIGKSHEVGDLVGRQVVVVANLEPAKLMGVESQGMVLAASIDGEAVLLHPARTVPNGSPVK